MRCHAQAGSDQGSRTRCFLFLDIDGVMIPFGDQAITPDCAANLRKIMTAVPELCIVMSSTWRAPPIERLERIWRQASLPWSWIRDCTPDLAGAPGSVPEKLRGLEIRCWLEDNTHEGAGYAILDDQTDEIEPCFPPSVIFRTDPMHGLTHSTARTIIRLLRRLQSKPRP